MYPVTHAYICDIPWYRAFPRNPFIINISMYFGATEKWHVQMVMDMRLQSPSLCSNLDDSRRINIVLWMLMYNQPKSS